MNKKQVEELRRKAEAIFNAEFADKAHADFSVVPFDIDAGVEINLTINTLQGRCVAELLNLAKEFNCDLSIHSYGGNLVIEIGSNENDGLTS